MNGQTDLKKAIPVRARVLYFDDLNIKSN